MKRPSAHVLTNVRLSPAMLKSLKYRAVEERRPVAAIVREAVEAYLAKPPAAKRDSDVVEWLQSLAKAAGKPKGPRTDWAVNHDHYLYGAPRKSDREPRSR